MEKEKNTFKQGTRKTHIRFHGVGGLLLLGGALAVGSLVATLAARKPNRRRDSDDKTSLSMRKEEKASQGLHFILQTSSPTTSHCNQCCTSHGLTEMAATKIDDPSELTSIPSLISEDQNPSSATNSNLESSENGDQEILLTYNSNSTKMCGKHCRVDEFSLPEMKNHMVKETNLLAITEIAEKDVTDAVRTSIEDLSLVQNAEEDYDEEKKKKQAKDKFLAEEKVEVAEKEEPIDVKICAEKVSLNSVEEGLPLMEIIEAKNEEATDEVEEEDAIKETLSTEEEDFDDEEENEQARERLLLEEKTEEEEWIAVETRAEKTSLVEVEDGDGNLGKESPMTDIPEVKNEEARGGVEEGAIQFPDKDDDENKQAKEKLLLEEKIEVEEEEKRIAVKTCAQNTSSNSVEEDDSVEHGGERASLMAKLKVKQEEESMDEVAEEDPICVLKMSIEKISSVQSMEEEDDDKEKKHSVYEQEDLGAIDERSDDEPILKKSDKSSQGTGSSPAMSDAEKIWPAESVEALAQELRNIVKNSDLAASKNAEQDGNNKTEEFNHYGGKGNSTFTKKEESLDFTVWHKQATKDLRKWRFADKHTLIMASILLFVLPIAMHYIIYLLRNNVYQQEQK